MEKNSRVEIGKTPAEDCSGESCCKIVNGNPVKTVDNNCFDKIANLVYNNCVDEKHLDSEEKQRKDKPTTESS